MLKTIIIYVAEGAALGFAGVIGMICFALLGEWLGRKFGKGI